MTDHTLIIDESGNVVGHPVPVIPEPSDLVADAELIDLIEELSALREDKRDITAREARVKERLHEALDGADGLAFEGRRVLTVTAAHRSGVDRKRLEAMFPEIFAEVRTESTSRVLTIDDDGLAFARSTIDARIEVDLTNETETTS